MPETTTTKTQSTTTDRTPAEVAKSYFEAVAARDPASMVEHWEPGQKGVIHGLVELELPDGHRSWFEGFFGAFPDLQFEVLSITSEGELAAVRWRAQGTFDGSSMFEGMEPNGKRIDLQGVDLLTVREGLIRDLHAYSNAVEMMRQLGALPEAGSGQEKAMLGALNARTKLTKRLRRR